MKLQRLLAFVAAMLMAGTILTAPAHASPYSEPCGDGTLPSCIQHCIAFHGGIRNLPNCLYAHWLV
jgi:hypothetical protein